MSEANEKVCCSCRYNIRSRKMGMSRGQRLELLKQIEKDIYVPSIESTLLEEAKSCAIHSVIAELEQEPTTKNDLAQERYQDLIEHFGDEKVAKTILESRKEFKAWLERIRWNVNRVDELDRELEQIKETTKNNLGVDAVSRQAVLELIADDDLSMGQVVKGIHALPSVTPQLSSGLEKNSKKLEKNFGELDCISRAQAQTEIKMNASRYTIAKERIGMRQVEWSDQLIKVSDAVNIIRALPSVTPQEPIWIPVSERLPKIADVYRVTRYYPKNVMNPNYLVDACFFDGSNWHNDNRINHERYYASNIIAWQENPEPYEPQESEE